MISLRLSPLFLAALLLAAPALAQERDGALPRSSPNASASLTLGVTEITVTYGAPSARNRTVLGELVPYGEVWRAGANEATTISFSTDVTVEGQPVAAGTYGLFLIPQEDEWTVVLNRTAEQWGAYQYDEAQDALRVSVSPERAPFQETMAFTFDNLALGEGEDAVDVAMRWAEAHVAFTVATDTDANVAVLGDRAMQDRDWRRPFAYARYALQSGRHPDRAVRWAEAAAAREESYATLSMVARAQAAAGDHNRARQTAQRAITMGERMTERPRDLEAFRTEVGAW